MLNKHKNKIMGNEKYYTIDEVAELFRVVYMTVYRWIRSGRLPAYKFGKQYMVKQSDIDEFVKSSKYKVEDKKPV